ncbi:Protein of unknown function [Gryllus bimaculatus]|nr:Protein of unknown function [Gryllus bimaculatus]
MSGATSFKSEISMPRKIWQLIFDKDNLRPYEISQDNVNVLNFKPRWEKTMDDLTGPLADQYRDAFGALPAAEINGEIPRAKRVKRLHISLEKKNQE